MQFYIFLDGQKVKYFYIQFIHTIHTYTATLVKITIIKIKINKGQV